MNTFGGASIPPACHVGSEVLSAILPPVIKEGNQLRKIRCFLKENFKLKRKQMSCCLTGETKFCIASIASPSNLGTPVYGIRKEFILLKVFTICE
ncbi:hypothetical protein AVEN_165081-1 [Araneus ventricosus]|uniref:Uncharacterized protein n=1 Tax=Araneus ventricosus TaxID=182803 RepID=A0A4Y2PC78_ARAVE|nr:hypothetical protein AVEN_165081-1 [Araneus ventricosus]